MGIILLKLKNKLLLEALKEYLEKAINGKDQYRVLDATEVNSADGCDVVIFDPTSLKEIEPNEFSGARKILIDTGLMEQEIIFYFLYYHLAGVFARDTAPELIFKCIEVVLKGEIWLSKNLMKIIWEELNSFTQKPVPSLTRKEREIVRLICDGLTNREIAEKLSLSEQTVKSHINRIFKKTGAKNRNQLIRIFLGGHHSNTHGIQTEESLKESTSRTGETIKKRLVLKSKLNP